MKLRKIPIDRLPIVEEKKLSIETIENQLIKYSYGCCLVINERREIVGYVDLRDCQNVKNVLAIVKKPPIFRSEDEIMLMLMQQNEKYILYPVVDECNQLSHAYYCVDNYQEIENEILQNLCFLNDSGYNMEHYFKYSKAKHITIAIYSDINHIKSSLIFAEKIQRVQDVDFVGVYILQDERKNIKENLLNYGISVAPLSA